MGERVFATVGSGKIPFNRILIKLDEAIEKGTLTAPVFAQIGVSSYKPKHFPSVPYLEREEFQKNVEGCSVLVTHGGVGSIMAGIEAGKPVVVFPRLGSLGENVDDHQLEISDAFVKKNLILLCRNEDDLGEIITKSRTHQFDTYVSGKENAMRMIASYLQKLQTKS